MLQRPGSTPDGGGWSLWMKILLIIVVAQALIQIIRWGSTAEPAHPVKPHTTTTFVTTKETGQ